MELRLLLLGKPYYISTRQIIRVLVPRLHPIPSSLLMASLVRTPPGRFLLKHPCYDNTYCFPHLNGCFLWAVWLNLLCTCLSLRIDLRL
jgi:hypothetical protein